ncbi:Co2+/Mg2+ efflux protein ApaG [Acuticoccus sp. MNP-M23]|uniref:Co2+/Mg2+ efflux protein ApaG n=1 Tax=Acuticoccus sp. MNP-M23 TaxID=3072793 RepID=UPI00281614A8|nr:Co2+/Mg2+ efflux protein ApaG [Acuticoccus sp. MNP-M23]WMS44495.1 Co2+/Mg2+ efflux protein ApaG [Acuticoccus sp. MNP-M23]
MYKANTRGIEVTVAPSFLPEHSSVEKSRYVWAYDVEIRNLSDVSVQLRHRYWTITDGTGHVERVEGPGVVGEEPVIASGESFRYNSGCPLTTPTGFMVGQYEMETAGGERFLVDVPAFSLDLPDARRTMN